MHTIVVVGGGYAGLHAVKRLHQELVAKGKQAVRLILIDKQPYHFRKVLLFKEAVDGELMEIPFARLLDPGVEFRQGAVEAIDPLNRSIRLQKESGDREVITYDRLVIALGSTIVQAPADWGGISLHSRENARRIREEMLELVAKARIASPEEARTLLSISVVGGGITGIETAAEISWWLRKTARHEGIDPALITVRLINAAQRLLPHRPEKLSRKVAEHLQKEGVQILHGARGERFTGQSLSLRDGRQLPTGLCIWTLGLRPNPLAAQLGLPVDEQGKLLVDAHYRVREYEGIYAIGDCAHIVDPQTGQADEMTCKEATAQAARLAKVIKAEMTGGQLPSHESHFPLYCIGLGPERGVIWFQPFGKNIDLFLTGKVGLKVRQLTWDMASFVNEPLRKSLQPEQSW